MKKTFLLICFLFLMSKSAIAQEWETLYQVYIESVHNPLQFDSFIEENDSAFNQEFNTCATNLINKLWPAAQEQIEVCNQHVNPEFKNKCMQENTLASAALWVFSLQQRVNDKTPWCNTLGGDAQCFGYQQCLQFAPLIGIDCRELMDYTLTNYGQTIAPYFDCR